MHRRTILRSAAVLAGTVGTGALGLTACVRNTASASVDPSALQRLIDTELAVIAAHDVALAAVPSSAEQRRIARRRAMHLAHFFALTSATPSSLANVAPLIALPVNPTPSGWVRWLAQHDMTASTIQVQVASTTTSVDLARTTALISAAERTHGADVSSAVPSRDWRPVNPGQGHLDALEGALETHYSALWVIGRIGHLLNRTDLNQVRKHFTEHTLTRDRLRRALLSAKQQPISPSPVYQLTRPVGDQTTAKTALRDVERNIIAAWLPVVMAAHSERDPASTTAAVIALGDAAVRATRWGNAEFFPGFGDALTLAP